jgi:aldose 1-epimerase
VSVQCITIADPSTGSSARVLTGYGFNCFEFRATRGGEPVDILWAEADFDQGQKRASGSGIPLLFPFPGRIPGTAFLWDGQQYPLEAGDGRGNAIHGFVLNRPWRVTAQDGQSVTGQFHASIDDPSLLKCWPADFCITVRYTLTGDSLETWIQIENPDQRPLPCGLGTHPYFRLPLGGKEANDCAIQLPVAGRWELSDMLPTGVKSSLADAAAYQAGRAFGELTLDDVFTDLLREGPWCTARILDPDSGTRLEVAFDDAFRECVVYTPPHREAICIEPYTCVPSAAELQSRNIDSGLRVLAPGASFEARVTMRVI